MGLNYPGLLVPSIIALVAVLYVLPWHIKIRNTATLSMSFWMTGLNLIHVVNCLVWNKGNDNKSPIWSDISANFNVGYNFGLPLSHLLLARQLESLTTLRHRSVLHDAALARRKKLIDKILIFAVPVVGVLVHLTQMDRRYYLIEGVGPLPSTYWNAWGVVWMALIPIAIALGALVYTVMALVNIYLRRQRMLSMITADTETNKDQFFRLYFLSIAEIGTCMLRAIFNMMSYTRGPSSLSRNTGAKAINLTEIGYITPEMKTPTMWMVMMLQWNTVVACSIVFFFCFVTGAETRIFYRRVYSKIFPCVDDPEKAGMLHLSSKGSSSQGSKFSNSQTSQGSMSKGELKLSYPDEPIALEYLQSPSTAKTSINQPSPTYCPWERRGSDGEPFADATRVESRGESLGGESVYALEGQQNSIEHQEEARRHWDELLTRPRSEGALSTMAGTTRSARIEIRREVWQT